MSKQSSLPLPDPFFLILDRKGFLRAHSFQESHPFYSLAQSCIEQTIEPLCSTIFGGFNKQALKHIFESGEGAGHSDIELPTPGYSLSLTWSRFGADDDCHLQLAPRVDPQSWLESAPHDELEKSPAALAALSLRLQQTESRLSTFLNSFPGVIFTQRTDKTFAFASSRISSFSGLSLSRIQRSTQAFAEFLHPEDRSRVLKSITQQSPEGHPYSLEYRIINQEDHSIRYVYDIRLPLLTAYGNHLQDEGIWIDITRQAIAEDRIAHSLWKENLATITSGLVHDFSNMMAGIYSLSELYHSEMQLDHPRYEGMSKVKSNAMKAQHLVRRIVDLNREVSGEMAYNNLEVLIREHLDIIKIILPKSAKVALEFPDDELLVSIDEVAFRRALTHLVTNARDAMQTGGTFGLYVEAVDDGYALHVWDDGPGIPEDIRDRVFDPFVSTKTEQTASGFGLYTVRQFVETSGGSLRLGKGRFRGAHIIISLPSADASRDASTSFEREHDHQADGAAPGSVANVAQESKARILAICSDPTRFDQAKSFLESPRWDLLLSENATEAAGRLAAADGPIGVTVWVLESQAEIAALDAIPLSPYADETLLAGLILDDSASIPGSTPVPFDILMPTRVGKAVIQQRIEPWLTG